MINLEIFNKLQEIGGSRLANKIIDLFFEHMPEKIHSLSNALQIKDLISLERTAHSMKSSAANLGLEKMQHLCTQLELKAREQNLDDCALLVSDILASYEKVNQLLRDQKKELEAAWKW